MFVEKKIEEVSQDLHLLSYRCSDGCRLESGRGEFGRTRCGWLLWRWGSVRIIILLHSVKMYIKICRSFDHASSDGDEGMPKSVKDKKKFYYVNTSKSFTIEFTYTHYISHLLFVNLTLNPCTNSAFSAQSRGNNASASSSYISRSTLKSPSSHLIFTRTRTFPAIYHFYFLAISRFHFLL